MFMINVNQRQQIHEFIVLDLAIRSLQHDFTQLKNLKLENLYTYWLEVILRTLTKQFQQQKQQLALQQLRLVTYRKIDHYFSEVIIATAGEDATLLYANNVLKYDVEQLIQQLIHISEE